MSNPASRSARRWTSALVVMAIVAVVLDIYQHSRSYVDRTRITQKERQLAAAAVELDTRLDAADAERKRLKGEVDVLKGLVSGLADPGVERD